MKDIFEAKIMCAKCNVRMDPKAVIKNGFSIRSVVCPECKDELVHPTDLSNYEKYNNLKGKTYNVKLRVVGNSHAISIPKEIVDFIHKQERVMDDMVRLCFEDMRKLSLMFGEDERRRI